MTTKSELTAKQEAFCIYYFAGKNFPQAAVKAGYSLKSAYSAGIANLRKPEIQARLAELQRQVVADDAIATVAERKSRLTALLRHDPETPVSPGHIIAATSELNKMEHVYESRIGGDTSVTVVNILVRGEHMKELLAKVAERTGELLPAQRETPVAEASEKQAEG